MYNADLSGTSFHVVCQAEEVGDSDWRVHIFAPEDEPCVPKFLQVWELGRDSDCRGKELAVVDGQRDEGYLRGKI